MSLFDELETTWDWFLPDDNNTTKVTSWDYDTVDFQADVNLLTLSDEEQLIFEQEMASNKANVDSSTASQLVKGARGRDGSGDIYEVTNTPLKRKLFPDEYTIRLKQVNK